MSGPTKTKKNNKKTNQKKGTSTAKKVLYYFKGSFTSKRHCHQPVQRHTEQDDEDHTEVGEGAERG